jgi:hypothetical protein
MGEFGGAVTLGRSDFETSKRPYLGRAGRSGVVLPLPVSDTDAERALNCGPVCSTRSKGDCNTFSPAVILEGMTDSLMLRACR